MKTNNLEVLPRYFRRYTLLAVSALSGCMPMVPGGNGNNNTNGNSNGDPNALDGGFVLEELESALLSISGSSPTDVYAVGSNSGDGNGPMMLHYDGTAWSRLDTGLADGDFWWITTPPVEGQFFVSGDPGLILRFDPAAGTFERCETPGDEVMFGVWGAALDDVWAVGGDFDNEDAGGVIWHFDGDAWSAIDVTTFAPAGLPTLYKIWGRSASEIYACGRLGTVLRFDGTAWSFADTSTTRTLFTIHGNHDLLVATGGSNSGAIQVLSEDAGVFEETANTMTPQMNGVFVTPAGDAYAVGIAALITRRDDEGEWVLQSTGLNSILDFHAAWIDDEGALWAVGGNLGLDLDQGIVAYFGSQGVPHVVGP